MRTHPFEAASLVFGVLFAGLGLAFLGGAIDIWQLQWSWFWPGVLTIAGLLVLLSARSDRTPPDPEDLGSPPAS